MGKRDDDDGLNRDSRKRLEKLAPEWSESRWPEKLTLPDLRLLLEHFPPLQDLIRAIVAVPEGEAPGRLAQETTDLRERLNEAEAAYRAAGEELDRVRAELEQAHSECRDLQKDLEQCSATAKQLLQTEKNLERARKQLEQQLQLVQEELSLCRAELANSGSDSAELALLRQDAELAERLGLADLPDDDQEALTRIVAVLAQRDNLERLWSALRERCEAQNRPASAAEQAILSAALAWYNHNWRKLPYRLIEAAPGTDYDFERHLRGRQTPTGETVTEMWLSGFADGSDRPICKALVSTH